MSNVPTFLDGQVIELGRTKDRDPRRWDGLYRHEQDTMDYLYPWAISEKRRNEKIAEMEKRWSIDPDRAKRIYNQILQAPLEEVDESEVIGTSSRPVIEF